MFSMTKIKNLKPQVGEEINFITFINLQHRWSKILTQKPKILSFWTNDVTKSRLLFFHHITEPKVFRPERRKRSFQANFLSRHLDRFPWGLSAQHHVFLLSKDNIMSFIQLLWYFQTIGRPLITIITGRNEVIFSQACVKNSVHGGEGVCLSACWDTPPPPRTRHPPGSRPPLGSRLQPTVNERPVRILLECILVHSAMET